MKKIIILLFALVLIVPVCLADMYVPEFDKMKVMRCDVVETTYNQDDKEISTTGYHRIFRLDDENKLLYLQKQLLNGLFSYDIDKIIYNDQYMTDFSIITTHVEIDRNTMKYTSTSKIEYDNPEFGIQEAVGVGECKYL